METNEQVPIIDTAEYNRLKTYVLTQPSLLKPPSFTEKVKSWLGKTITFIKSFNVKEAPEADHISPLKNILPKENEYPDPTPKK